MYINTIKTVSYDDQKTVMDTKTTLLRLGREFESRFPLQNSLSPVSTETGLFFGLLSPE
jgi:hypothetical protein